MSVRVDDQWSYSGLPVVRIENEALAVDVVPAMGGKLLHLVDKAADRNVLWRNPRVTVRPGPLQADVDDYFAGGWDDAFPTGDACLSEYGERLPYMGELWNLALDTHVDRGGPDEAVLTLDGQTPITPARWTRTLTLRSGEPLLRLRTRIENVGHRPFSFSWGSHPALSVHAGMRIDVPAAEGEVTDAGGGALGTLGERYAYPTLRAGTDGALDVRTVPSPALADHALHALTGLRAGWFAATDPDLRRGFGVAFDARLASLRVAVDGLRRLPRLVSRDRRAVDRAAAGPRRCYGGRTGVARRAWRGARERDDGGLVQRPGAGGLARRGWSRVVGRPAHLLSAERVTGRVADDAGPGRHA